MLATLSSAGQIKNSANSQKQVRKIRPLEDPRWDEFVATHPRASAFHSREWLNSLQKTYGYTPIAYTSTPENAPRLCDAFVFCEVKSWLTGRRLVSLPFSDHCEPLIENADFPAFIDRLRADASSEKWKYIEIRPLEALAADVPCQQVVANYTLHQVDLNRELSAIFHSFHKDSIQRKIKRAEREGLICESGRSDSLLNTFYRLLALARRRHGVPPQPKAWFVNLIEAFGPALQISVAYKGKMPLAAMMTLRHQNTLIYKYGGSDARFNKYGSMHLLYWESIRRAKESGLTTFDLGRSDIDQHGLIRFKSRWGATQSTLSYFRLTPDSNQQRHCFEPSKQSWKTNSGKALMTRIPLPLMSQIGKLLYRHIG